jgi:hypothetical protein
MHYKTPRIRYELGLLKDFLARLPDAPVESRAESWLKLTPENLPDSRTIAHLLREADLARARADAQGDRGGPGRRREVAVTGVLYQLPEAA